MDLADHIEARFVVADLGPGPVREVLERLVAPLAEAGEIDDADALVDRLMQREGLQSTGIGSGVAVPHCICDELERPRVVVGVCTPGTEFHALDDRPVQLFFLLLSPRDEVRRHVRLLARIARLTRRPDLLSPRDEVRRHVRLLARIARLTRRPALLEQIRSAGEPDEVVEALRTYERDRV